jgi:four helix bundle protein
MHKYFTEYRRGKRKIFEKRIYSFFHISRSSLFEVITLLTILKNRKWISEDAFVKLKSDAFEIGKMINGLINSIKSKT